MAYVSHEHRLIFFAAPGTGSSAVIRAFEQAGIGEPYPPADIVRRGRTVTRGKHSTARELEAGGLYAPVADYLKVVGVRSLYTWLVAKYLRNRTKRLRNVNNPKSWVQRLPPRERQRYTRQIRRRAAMSFAEFVRDRLDRFEAVDPHENFHAGMDVFLHQEALDADFAALVRRAGLPTGLAVPVANVTGAMEDGRTWRDFYDDALIAYVERKCAPFFRRFPEYGLDGLDAAQAAAIREAVASGPPVRP